MAGVPLLSDAELLMSPVMKEDSDCFLTVSFHILRMRLCGERKRQNMSAGWILQPPRESRLLEGKV